MGTPPPLALWPTLSSSAHLQGFVGMVWELCRSTGKGLISLGGPRRDELSSV